MIYIYLILLNDFIGFIMYSLTGSAFLGKSTLFFMEAIIIIYASYFFIKYKLFNLKKFFPHLIFFFICYLYLFLNIFIEKQLSFESLKIIRLISVPFNLMIIGHVYRISGYNYKRILIKCYYFCLIVAIYSIVENFILSNISFYNQVFNISDYYTNVKNQPMGIGANNFSRLSAIGLNYRSGGLMLDPLANGFIISSGLILLIYNYASKSYLLEKKIPVISIFIFLIGIISTQSRSALLFVFIALIPLAFKNKKILLGYSISIIFFAAIINKYLMEFIFGIFVLGNDHFQGIIDFYLKLADINYFLGRGFGNIDILESGFGFYYSQFGYLGLFSFFGILLYYLYKLSINNYVHLFIVGSLIGIIIINNFHYYHLSIKGFGLIWIIIGNVNFITRRYEVVT